MRRHLKQQVFALLLALVLLGGGSSVDGARRAPAPRAAPGSLFERQPLGFDGTTVQRIVTGVRSLPERLPELMRERGGALGVIGAISLLFLIVVLAYGVFGALVLQAAWTFEVPSDVISLAYAVFELSLIALLGVYLARRRAVMALFPDVPNRIYRRFVTALDRVYFVALAVTLVTA